MKKLIAHLEREVPNSLYLAIFRLFVCFHLLKKVVLLAPSANVLYGTDAFVHHEAASFFGIPLDVFRTHYDLLIPVYVFLIGLFLFGIGRNLTALFLYIVFRLFQEMTGVVSNGGDNLLAFIMLYLVFANSYRYFAVKSEFLRMPRKLDNFVTNLSCGSIMVHLCLVYFFSAVGKLNTQEWYKGVALYYTLASERFGGTPINVVLVKNVVFTTFGTYFTLLFQMAFPFLIWIRRMRIPLAIAGMAMHLSIYVLLMIHDFAILFIFIFVYGFFFTNQEIMRAYHKAKRLFPSKKIMTGNQILNKQSAKMKKMLAILLALCCYFPLSAQTKAQKDSINKNIQLYKDSVKREVKLYRDSLKREIKRYESEAKYQTVQRFRKKEGVLGQKRSASFREAGHRAVSSRAEQTGPENTEYRRFGQHQTPCRRDPR